MMYRIRCRPFLFLFSMVSCQSGFAFLQQQQQHNNSDDDNNSNNNSTTTITTKINHNHRVIFMMEMMQMLVMTMRRDKLNVGFWRRPCHSSIASSVPLLSFGVHALESVNRKQYPLIRSGSLCFTVSRPLLFSNINTNINNNKNRKRYDDEEDRMVNSKQCPPHWTLSFIRRSSKPFYYSDCILTFWASDN